MEWRSIVVNIIIFICCINTVVAAADNYCAMYGVCGVDGKLKNNCVYHGRPKTLLHSNTSTSSSAIVDLRQLCPHLFTTDDDNSNPAVCCDAEQVDTLKAQFSLPRQLLSRCPSCFANFAKLWCDFTCSPKQGQFVRIIDTRVDLHSRTPNITSYVIGVEYYIRRAFVDATFESCRGVRSFGSDYALTFVCGMPAAECTPTKWLDFMGTYNPAIGIPFDIRFIQQDDDANSTNYVAPSLDWTPCHLSPDLTTSSCSCQDCDAACSSLAPFPSLADGGCKIAAMECLVAMSMLAFGGLCFAVMFMIVLHFVLRSDHESTDDDDLSDYKTAAGTLSERDVTRIENVGAWLEHRLETACNMYGRFCTQHPLIVLGFGLAVALICSCGLIKVRFTTDPVELWSSPGSRARIEKQYFDENFAPFYRVEQVIVYPRDQSFWDHANRSNLDNPVGYYGPTFRKEFLRNVLRMQTEITQLIAIYNNETIRLDDICFQPMAPDNRNCTIMSLLNYFQNDDDALDVLFEEEADFFDAHDYFDHIVTCMSNPFNVQTKLKLSCLSAFGGPIQPYVVLGDFNHTDDYTSARGLVITFLVNNDNSYEQRRRAEAWEAQFINYMRNVSQPNFTVSFSAERSIQDEIDRESKSDAFTILISYMFMFGYVAFALGQYQVTGNNLCSLLVHSKMMLGVAGVLIVALSVTSSIGVYAFYGIPATMIILEVQPFLVLAVGIDNIFIFVQAYQRAHNRLNEDLYIRMGRISGEVIPSMLLSSLAECLCFFLGALSSMPAVKVFSLYAASAIFFDFFLQITCFLALFTLDVRRQEAGRLEICCCNQLPIQVIENDGYLFSMFKKVYAPILLSKFVRVGVILTFLAWLCSSIAVLNRIELGLDQKMAVPEDSYVLSHFRNMDRFLSVGPPVYFVVKGNLNYAMPSVQNRICDQSGCDQKSLGGQIGHAAKWSNISYIAHPAMNWLDDYLDWLQPAGQPPCCRQFSNNSFCSATIMSDSCTSCNVTFDGSRPRSDHFHQHIRQFLNDNPSSKCSKGGHAAFGSALKLSKSNRVISSYFMTYHTVLKRSGDYISAMSSARAMAVNISEMLNADRNIDDDVIQVFPYSIFYVFYEQYSTIVSDAILQLILSLAAIFVVTTVLLGLDPWSGATVVLVIACILLNLIGLMYWWSIDFNAISLVNLVMAVGISVEFCSHIVRAFALSVQRMRVDRAREALATMGSSVLSGITLTKFGGILVLAFAHSQIFKVFYFRMFLGIVVIGAAHGLVLLPVVLSFVGPPVNKRKLLMRMQTDDSTMNIDVTNSEEFRLRRDGGVGNNSNSRHQLVVTHMLTNS